MDHSAALTRDSSISLIRLTGTVCILLCHLSSWFGIAALAQLFNVGVPVFLLISGFLYGGKAISVWGGEVWFDMTMPLS